MKLTSLAIVASISFQLLSCQNNTTKRADSQSTLTETNIQTMDFIPVDSANKMIQSYLTSIGSGSGNLNLQSLILDANTLRAYLSDTSITEIKVMFAHSLDYINSGHGGQPAGYTPNAFTIVLGGFNATGNYVLAPGSAVPNRAKPCPTDCPTVGTASNPLLQ